MARGSPLPVQAGTPADLRTAPALPPRHRGPGLRHDAGHRTRLVPAADLALLAPHRASVRAELLQPLEAARVGKPAGEHGTAEHDAEPLEQAFRQVSVSGASTRKCAPSATAWVAPSASTQCTPTRNAPLRSTCRLCPIQRNSDAVATCQCRDAHGIDVRAHHEDAMARRARCGHGLGVEVSAPSSGTGTRMVCAARPRIDCTRLAGCEDAREPWQAQCRDDGAVGLEQVVLRQVVGQRPGQCLRLERLRLALIVGDLPDVEQHAPVRVRVPQPDERPRRAHGDAELLGELALQSREGLLARGELAAGNSQRPAMWRPRGRCAISTRPSASAMAPATTWISAGSSIRGLPDEPGKV